MPVFSTISASSSVACKFDSLDVCGYQDLSEAGINWSQINNQCKSFTAFL